MSQFVKCSTSCPTFSWCLAQHSPAEDEGGGCESHRKQRSYPTPSQPHSFHLPCKVPCFYMLSSPKAEIQTTIESRWQVLLLSFPSSLIHFQIFFGTISLRSIAQVHLLHSLSNAILANLDGSIAAHQNKSTESIAILANLDGNLTAHLNKSTVANTRIDVGHSPKSGTNLAAPSQDGSNSTLSQGRCFYRFLVACCISFKV